MKSLKNRDKIKVRIHLMNIIEKWIELIKNLEEHNNNFMLIFELSIIMKIKSRTNNMNMKKQMCDGPIS